MLFDLQILNSDAVLNTFIQIEVQRFQPGSAFDMVVRIHDSDKGIRYIPDVAATTEITLLKSDGTDFTIAGSFPFPNDRSIVKFIISAVQSADLIGQNLTLKITEGANESFAVLKNGVQSASLGC